METVKGMFGRLQIVLFCVGVVLFPCLSHAAISCQSCGEPCSIDQRFCQNCGREIVEGSTDYYFAGGLFAPGVALPIWHSEGKALRENLHGVSISIANVFPYSTRSYGVALGLINLLDKFSGVVVGFNNCIGGNGVMIGLGNYSEGYKGVQVGILNINKGGPIPFLPIINFGW